MATNPMLQAVLLFAHHQVNTPYMPHPGVATTPAQGIAKPADEKEDLVYKPPFDPTEDDDEEEEEEQKGEETDG